MSRTSKLTESTQSVHDYLRSLQTTGDSGPLETMAFVLGEIRSMERREKEDEEKTRSAREQAQSQAEGIAEMVAACSVDYDRLEELNEDLESLQESVFDAMETLDDEENEESENRRNNEPVDDACEALNDAETELSDWGKENGDELRDLRDAAGDCTSDDDARERIQEDPLSVEIRADWYSPGETPDASEFMILLCTGGPAVRIVGELDQYKQPSRAWMEYQDWFTPWIEYHGPLDNDSLLTYCQQFYFGD